MIPADYCRCLDAECRLRNTCARFQDRGVAGERYTIAQSMYGPDDVVCRFYIEHEEPMSKLSRDKGKRGERQVRDLFRDVGLMARRGQQFAGGADSPDVIVPEIEKDWHVECKWVEGICGAKMRAAILQAQTDAGGKAWTVFHKENNNQWLVTLDAREFVRVLAATL